MAKDTVDTEYTSQKKKRTEASLYLRTCPALSSIVIIVTRIVICTMPDMNQLSQYTQVFRPWIRITSLRCSCFS